MGTFLNNHLYFQATLRLGFCLFRREIPHALIDNRLSLTMGLNLEIQGHFTLEPRREKTGLLPMRKQRRRSASQ